MKPGLIDMAIRNFNRRGGDLSLKRYSDEQLRAPSGEGADERYRRDVTFPL